MEKYKTEMTKHLRELKNTCTTTLLQARIFHNSFQKDCNKIAAFLLYVNNLK